MAALRVHKDFQKVRFLPFCYLCGRDLTDDDEKDGDHVPPRTAFNSRDRQPVLKLQTHKECNGALSIDDKKVGQLIALRRRQGPSSARDAALEFAQYPGLGIAVTNLDIDLAVWRWIRGFHAALYRQPLVTSFYAIVTPFPRANLSSGVPKLRTLREQHALAVRVIKYNRVANKLDLIEGNNGKLRYQCAWCLSDDGKRWCCMFGLDIYDWKDLGSHTAEIPARGCAGMYSLSDYSRPKDSTIGKWPAIEIPNVDVLDPFGR